MSCLHRLATAVVALFVVALFGAAPANAVTALPGNVWTETLPTGERVEFQRTAEGMDVSTHALTKRSVLSCPSNQDAACVWTGDNYSGTMGKYNTNNVYANTANGVAHCWNMSSPFHDNTKSWANFSDRSIDWVNWANCNYGGEWMTMNINSHWGCSFFPRWCGSPAAGYPRTSSIKAF